jgi:hypothetical protein
MTKTGAPITPYDLRRTYMAWFQLATIPRTRRRLYMGHGAKDVSDLYEAYEVTEFLVADAKKSRTALGLAEPSSTVSPTVAIAK